MTVLLALPAVAGNKGKPAEFGITSTRAKIDSSTEGGWIPTYGPGDSLIIQGDSIYAFYPIETGDGAVEIRMSISDDGGLSWDDTRLIARGSGFDGNGVAAATGPDPTVPGRTLFHVAWADRSLGQVLYTKGYVRSGTYPRWIWSPPLTVSGASWVSGETRSIAADANGGVHIAFKGSLTGLGRVVFYSRSVDAGNSFEAPQTVAIEQCDEPDIAADALGNVFIAWEGPGLSGWTQTRFSKRMVGDTDFITPVTVNTVYNGYRPSLAIIDQNSMCMAWAFGGVTVACTTNGGSQSTDWTEYLITTDGADTTHLAVDGNGVWNLTWLGLEAGARGIYFSRSTTDVSRWLTPTLVDAAGDLSPKIAVDAAGLAHIAYPNYWWTALYFSKEKEFVAR